MNINSNNENKLMYFASVIQQLLQIATYITILGMSYNKMVPNELTVVSLLFLVMIFQNFSFSLMSKEAFKLMEDNAYMYMMNKHRFLTPIGIILALVMLVTLITGNMFVWYWYLGMVILSIFITKMHKQRVNNI